MMENGKILGIDYGEKNIGLAISAGEIAEPLGVFNLSSTLSVLLPLCKKEKIARIVIGLSEGEMAEKTKKFGRMLRKTTGLPIEFWEETLSSQGAIKKMIEAGKARRRRKTDEHAVAACLILQDFLDNLSDE